MSAVISSKQYEPKRFGFGSQAKNSIGSNIAGAQPPPQDLFARHSKLVNDKFRPLGLHLGEHGRGVARAVVISALLVTGFLVGVKTIPVFTFLGIVNLIIALAYCIHNEGNIVAKNYRMARFEALKQKDKESGMAQDILQQVEIDDGREAP